jgi:gamma-glutamylcyclotransferase
VTKLHFAYGSNLWLEQITKRCPNHRFIGNGVLKGYRWIISTRGYANIVKSTPDEVHGVVYEITKSDEETLDRCEGVNSGSYRKEILFVEVNGQNQSCLVYVDPVIHAGKPKEEYIERINKGVLDAKLSPEYVRRYIREFIPESCNKVED